MTETDKEIFENNGWTRNIPVKMLFCDRRNGDPETILETVHEFVIPFANSYDMVVYITDIFEECNKQLRQILINKKVKHFIPFQKPTFKMADKFEICYWFARTIYEKVYESEPGYVMMPTGELLWKLEKFYEAYLLDGWEDPRNFSSDS